MSLQAVLSHPTVERVGWTLIHFLWQAAALAAVFAVELALLRKSKANWRYLAACLTLALMLLAPCLTMFMVPVSQSALAAESDATVSTPPLPPSPSNIEFAVPAEASAPEAPHPEPAPSMETAHSDVAVRPARRWQERAAALMEPALPYLVLGWLAGVLGLSIWHLGGWAQLQRLRRRMVKPVDRNLRSKLRELAESLGVRRAVALMESALVQVPTVVGWLKPVILLPASAITGLTTGQLEAVLAHELAHIRRLDYLVNMVQTAVEILGFFHPAVWWVSHKIRIERENCCDDVAVSVTGDKVRYARALATLEEMRGKRPALAVAAGGVGLLDRIRRLVGTGSAEQPRYTWLPAAITILLILAIAVPTTIALSTAGHKKANAEVEGGWGEAVEGVQMRVRPERLTWYESETPKFFADIRNNGTVEWTLGLTQSSWRVELDGIWYEAGTLFTGDFRTLLLGPRAEHTDIECAPEQRSNWNIHGKPLRFTPGWHTVRLACGASTRDRAYPRMLRVVSNPVVIEVLATGESLRTVDAEADAAKTLEAELHEVWRQRERDLSGAEAYGLKLLEKYTEPEQQSLIYYQLAEIYAQSGQISPSKTIEYAKQGWWNLNDPVKKARLFVYWGSALELSKERREAARVYLRGLRFCVESGLPKEKPERPAVSKYSINGPPALAEEYRRKNQLEMAARKHAQFIGDMVEQRRALTGQIVQLYAQEPDAFDELRELVMKHLGSERAAEQLIAAAKAYRTNHKTTIPVFTSIGGGDPNPQADLGWGEPSGGIRVRLRAESTTWRAGQTPKFEIDVRNDGSHILMLTPEPECWQVEVDGVRYNVAVAMADSDARSMSFGPDKRWYNLELSLDAVSGLVGAKGRAESTPGRHIMRAILAGARSAGGIVIPIGAMSEPVEIEILRGETQASEAAETEPRSAQVETPIGYVDNTAEGKRSLGGSGHAVMFERPPAYRYRDTRRYVEAVEIFAARYGTPTPPKEDFHLYILDEDQNVRADLPYPYAMIERGGLRWYTLTTPSIEIPDRFYVALSFNPHRTKGIYLGLDESVKESHSYTGLPNKGFEKVPQPYDWMVRVHMSAEPNAAKGVKRFDEKTANQRAAATLSNGATVELVGVYRGERIDDLVFWKPDGSSFSDSQTQKYKERVVFPEWANKDFRFEYGLMIRFGPLDDLNTDLFVKQGQRMSYRYPRSDGIAIALVASDWNDRKEGLSEVGNIKAAAAYGPWETRKWTAIINEPSVRYLDDHSNIMISPPRKNDEWLLDVTVNAGNIDFECSYQVKDGSIHQAERRGTMGHPSWIGPDQRTPMICKRYALSHEPQEIREYIIKYRRFEIVEFKNVSLKPGFKTNLKLVVPPAVPKTSSDPIASEVRERPGPREDEDGPKEEGKAYRRIMNRSEAGQRR